MKAMILAAGRGERMKPLTNTCPKPLLTVKGKPLIVYHIEQLHAVGITDLVINHAWLGDKIENTLGNGEKWQVNIVYSAESKALETAGGIIKALPLLTAENADNQSNKGTNNDTFVVINGDVFTDFDFKNLPILDDDVLAHLWLVPNPEHNTKGDFCIVNGLLQNPMNSEGSLASNKSYTYSGIALFKPAFFKADFSEEVSINQDDDLDKRPLAPMLRVAANKKQISASILPATWTDVGTPERLAQLNRVD